MDAEEALRFVDNLLAERKKKRLSDLQRKVLLGCWEDRDYKEIHQDCNESVSLPHLMRNVGPRLWKLLSEVVEETVNKQNLRGPIERAWERHSASQNTSNSRSSQEAERTEPSPDRPQTPPSPRTSWIAPVSNLDFVERSPILEDWNVERPDTSNFHGRWRQQEELSQWICLDGCRMVLLYGLPGVGKTSLAAKLVEQVKGQFEVLIWRSLKSGSLRPPLLPELLTDLLRVLSEEAIAHPNPSELYHYLKERACLIVLDGFEVVLEAGQHDGNYCPGYEPYGELLERLGENAHQSCVIVTSREQPLEIEQMQGHRRAVRELQVLGLGAWEGRNLFEERGSFVNTSEQDWQNLFSCYEGNPRFLNLAATHILKLFGGNVSQYLAYVQTDTELLSDIRISFDHLFERLSDLEKQIIRCLTNNLEPLNLSVISEVFVPKKISLVHLSAALMSLRRRSLIASDSSANYQVCSSLLRRYIDGQSG